MFVEFTQSNGQKTIWVNKNLVTTFAPAQQGSGTTIMMSNSIGFGVDQTPAEVLTAFS